MKIFSETFLREKFKEEINWEYWDKLVEKTKKEIQIAIEEYRAKLQNSKTCYIYNNEGELVYKFFSKKECTQLLNGNEATISNYLKKQWNYKGYLLSWEPLRKDIAFAIYRYNVEHGNVYISGTTNKKKPIFCYNSEGKLVAAFDSQLSFTKAHNKAHSSIKNDRICEDRLISRNRYTELEAKRLYKKVKGKTTNQLSLYIYNLDGDLIKEKTRTGEAIRIAKTKYTTIYKNLALKPYFIRNGYIISKQPLTPPEAKEIALESNNK